MKNKGFTLIELLVVIAIIGILSSVVLASLNSARSKGADAAIRGNLAGIRAQSEMFYDVGNTYTGACASSTAALEAMKSARGGDTTLVTVFATPGAAGQVTCHDSADAWAVEAPLKATSDFACVDSTGVSTTTSASTLGASDAACGIQE